MHNLPGMKAFSATHPRASGQISRPSASFPLVRAETNPLLILIEADANFLAFFRIKQTDIECAGRRGVFPEPEQDPVIQIANVVSVQGEPNPIVRNVFTVKKCSPIVGAEVRCYRTEVNSP